MKIVIPIEPRTKKNSQQIIIVKGRPMIIPSSVYKKYEKECSTWLEDYKDLKIDSPINLKCEYYMKTKRRVDLVNLIEATNDILVKYGILVDDNSNIVHSHNGSVVGYDKENPRVEITIDKVTIEK